MILKIDDIVLSRWRWILFYCLKDEK
jgi:hypothetical protein